MVLSATRKHLLNPLACDPCLPLFYRLYSLDGTGRIDFADWIKAQDDSDAVAQARIAKRSALRCEVWQGKRLVARLELADLAADLATDYQFARRVTQSAQPPP